MPFFKKKKERPFGRRCLAVDRSRSASCNILTQVRRFTALRLSRLLTQHVHWIPSEINYCDEASRITDGSKCRRLLHLLRFGGDEASRSAKFPSSVDGQIARGSDAAPCGCQAVKYSSTASPMPDKPSHSFQNPTSTQCQSATRLGSKSQRASARSPSAGSLRTFDSGVGEPLHKQRVGMHGRKISKTKRPDSQWEHVTESGSTLNSSSRARTVRTLSSRTLRSWLRHINSIEKRSMRGTCGTTRIKCNR